MIIPNIDLMQPTVIARAKTVEDKDDRSLARFIFGGFLITAYTQN